MLLPTNIHKCRSNGRSNFGKPKCALPYGSAKTALCPHLRGCCAFLCGDPSTPPSVSLRMTVACLPRRRRFAKGDRAGGVISASRNVPCPTRMLRVPMRRSFAPPSVPLRMTVVCSPHRRRSVYTVQAGGVISASRNVPSSTGLCGKMLRCRADFTVRKAPPMGELSAELTERAFHGESAAFALSPAIAGALPRGEP